MVKFWDILISSFLPALVMTAITVLTLWFSYESSEMKKRRVDKAVLKVSGSVFATKVFMFLREQGSLNVYEIAGLTLLPPETIREAIKLLAEKGLVESYSNPKSIVPLLPDFIPWSLPSRKRLSELLGQKSVTA